METLLQPRQRIKKVMVVHDGGELPPRSGGVEGHDGLIVLLVDGHLLAVGEEPEAVGALLRGTDLHRLVPRAARSCCSPPRHHISRRSRAGGCRAILLLIRAE